MSITNIFKPISDLWRYYGYYCKARKIQSDFDMMKSKWTSIGGINADTPQLIDFLEEYAQFCAEYATWTPTQLDDKGAGIILYILKTHRNIVQTLINAVRTDREIKPLELADIAFEVGDWNNPSVSPLTVLGFLINIYHVLQYLKNDSIEPPPQPEVVPPTPEPKRPVINFLRALFNRT
jgi:hypothetical protein